MKRLQIYILIYFIISISLTVHATSAPFSIQSALDSNPGRIVYVPTGEHIISKPLTITHDDSGLYGPGRIIQNNASVPILIIRNADNVRIRDLVFIRAEANEDTKSPGIEASNCANLVLDGLQILNNRSPSGSIRLERCRYSEITGCLVKNYMTLSIDDRTQSPDWGYAFNCIDGTGIVVNSSTGTLIDNNRILETDFRPTQDLKKQHRLGYFVKKGVTKGTIISEEAWDAEYVNNWHQGSGLIVTSPESSDFTRITGNHIENAAQGIDIHADHVIVQGNVVVNSFMGMKAMHGSRNILIIGNQFSRNDLWSIGLMPGAASHTAAERMSANEDGGSIIANNIISDFGLGDSHWIWKDHRCTPILLDRGQRQDNPPLHDVIISGNVIYDWRFNGAGNQKPEPRYDYAIFISSDEGKPEGLIFSHNLFPSGKRGICNIDIKP